MMNSDKPEYSKPAKDFEDLANELSLRFRSGGKKEIQKQLNLVGYYRLKGYWFRFKSETQFVELPSGEKKSKIEADFSDIKNLYNFDRALRFMLLDAIERIEVCVRTQLIHESAMQTSVFGYLDSNSYAGQVQDASQGTPADLVKKVQEQIDRSKKSTQSIRAFYAKYSNAYPPICIAGEVFDFGTTCRLFKFAPPETKRRIARFLGVPDHKILNSWLAVLNDVRNACAHHNRVWDRRWAKVPQMLRSWKNFSLEPRGTGVIFFICRFLLNACAPESFWEKRVRDIFAESRFSKIPLKEIGFPEDWQENPLWEMQGMIDN